MAFAMRDEWKDEPVSTTGASYVEPSGYGVSVWPRLGGLKWLRPMSGGVTGFLWRLEVAPP